MQANKKIMLFLAQLLLIFVLSGCQIPQAPVEIILPFSPAGGQRSGSVAKRFQESAPQGPTVVESAMELSKKYAKLSEEASALRQKNQELVAENRYLKNQVVALDVQLQQTKEELTEANDLLREMVIELNSWKANVLGFQGEMRDADTAQLEALLKILNILGGEVKAESAQGENAGSAVVSSGQPSRSQPQSLYAGTTLGESNE